MGLRDVFGRGCCDLVMFVSATWMWLPVRSYARPVSCADDFFVMMAR
jgi:hypothetical protein